MNSLMIMDYYGMIWECCFDVFGMFWGYVGIILRTLFDDAGMTWESFLIILEHFEYSYRGELHTPK